jgi:hypothetical protein
MGLVAIISLAVGLFQLLPQIIKTILEMEALIKGDNLGAVKKELLMNALTVADVPPILIDKASVLVDKSVATLNASKLLGNSIITPSV